MRIFVAGATGALGTELVQQLLSRGYEVTGLAKTSRRTTALQDLGIEVQVADALDASAVHEAVKRSRPDAVVHALTAIPESGPVKPKDLDATNTLRIVGTKNLLAAAIASGARRFVAESNMYVYGFGDLGNEMLDESIPVPRRTPKASLRPIIDALVSEEHEIVAATGAGRIEGACLRFGGLYGPRASDQLVHMLQRRRLPMPKQSQSRGIPWIHVEDAAAAIVAALTCEKPSAIYNVVDDEAVPATTFVRELARYIGAPEPMNVPGWVVRLAAPMGADALLDTTIRLSNAKAKRELGWSPRFKTIELGLRHYASAYAHQQESRTNVNAPRDRIYGRSR